VTETGPGRLADGWAGSGLADGWAGSGRLPDGWAAGHLMLAFDGARVPAWVRRRIRDRAPAGFTLFRFVNVASATQVRALTSALQSALPTGSPPLLIAADQEGGQFLALGEETTPFAGNMALGATGDPRLAERVGAAIGRELRAVGVNVDYAPVLDLATEPANPALGIRSFGDDPVEAGGLAAAFVRGLQAEGVAATVKHFPGKGDAASDTHHGPATVAHDRGRFHAVELAPFRAAFDAGARLVMSGHFAVPRLTGSADLPSTLSRTVMDRLLRADLGFEGVAITDALDMRALAQGPAQAVDVIAALHAGVDLLLCARDRQAQARVEQALEQAGARQLFDPDRLAASAERVADLRRWLGGFEQPPLEVVGCEAHRRLARELAERSVTLVRDDAGLLPLRADGEVAILAIQPEPADLTPADTSSTVRPQLAEALAARGLRVRPCVLPLRPSPDDVAAAAAAAREADVVVAGTYAASFHPEQAAVVEAVLAMSVPTITVALRTPWDLATYPTAPTHVCTYGILRPQLDALAAALVGAILFQGRLPVAIAA